VREYTRPTRQNIGHFGGGSESKTTPRAAFMNVIYITASTAVQAILYAMGKVKGRIDFRPQQFRDPSTDFQ